jgi:hypothetical protein
MALRSEPYRNGSDSYLISIKPLPCSDEENKRIMDGVAARTRYDLNCCVKKLFRSEQRFPVALDLIFWHNISNGPHLNSERAG